MDVGWTSAAAAVASDGGAPPAPAVLASPATATIFHDPRWLDAVEHATGNRAHRLVARDKGRGAPAFLPLTHMRSRLFGDALVSTGFAVGGGIVADEQDAVVDLADQAVALARTLGVGTIELRGGPVPPGWHAVTGVHAGFARPLAASRDAELAAIPRKHRAEVRKGLAAPLSVSVGRDAAHRDAHWRVYATSVRNLGTPVFPRRLFDAMLDAFEDADIMVVRGPDAQPVSAVLSLYRDGAVMPYWGGGTIAARALRANERLYFELMDHARRAGATRFDFGRSKVGSGPYAYKRNWGFAPEPLTYARWTADGGQGRDIDPTSPRRRMLVRAWSRLPLWVANRAGPLIARGLG